jgi:alpha-glucosidase
MMRALFLDYPDAAKDGHPLDIDPGVDSEFLLGHDLLVAPSPYPEEPDDYTVEFPTAHWYDFWTGAPVPPRPPAMMTEASTNAPASPADLVPLATTVKPQLAELPVYVRGGAILPMEPLTQSTSEVPQGPLTLRVYMGDNCRGTLYTDDGTTFDYKQGQYLRVNFACSVQANTLTLSISKHEGSYPACWKDLRIEVYGWHGANHRARLDNGQSAQETSLPNGFTLTAPDNGSGETIRLD